MTGEGDSGLAAISAAQLSAVFDSIPMRIALLDRDRRYRYVNRGYVNFVGGTAEEILGRRLPDVLADEAYTAFHAQDDRALVGETVLWEGWVHHQAGPQYMHRTCIPLRNAAGCLDGYFTFSRDLTELKRGEQALAQQLAARAAGDILNAAVIEWALDCIITIDEDGRVVEFNPAAERTFLRSRDEVLGRKIGDLIVPPELRQRHADGFARYLRTGEAHVLGRRIELEAMRADGNVFPVELTITEVRLPERRLFTAHLRDLTAARAAMAEIQRQREALHQSQKMAAFGSLLAGVAHELNNPLSIVIGNALMLEEEAQSTAPALVDRTQRLHAAAQRCVAIVRSFLAMARQREIVKGRLAVQALVDAALRILTYGMRSSGVSVQLDIPPEMPALLCDADQMQQVMTNLLLNACQALEAQPLPRLVWVVARAEPAWIRIEVADNGPGVAHEVRDAIFDPFFTTKPAGVGTGIGLNVSRGIVEAHGGSLMLAADDGPPQGRAGARFVLRLPVEGSEVQAPVIAAVEPATPSRIERSALVVDDEAEVARLMCEMLAPLGFHCDIAREGGAALSLLQGRDFDVVLCDVRMPEIDGPALYSWMQKHKAHLCARTVFVTGDTLGAAAAGFLARSGRPVLEKPFVPGELARLIAQLEAEHGGGPSSL